MTFWGWISSGVLLTSVLGAGAGLAAWKYNALRQSTAAAAHQPEPVETVTVAVAVPREHRRTTTSIGTVLAMRSVTVRRVSGGSGGS